MVVLLLIFYMVSACIDSYASEHNKMRDFKLFLVPSLLAILSFYKNFDILLFISLFLCFVGDIFLMNKTIQNIQKGTIAFLFAHIMYTVDFFHISAYTNLFFWIGLVIYIIGFACFMKFMYPMIQKKYQKVSVIYMLILMAMSFSSYSRMIITGDFLTWIGSLSFLISDSLIIYQFSKELPQRGVMETYSIAQLFIVLGSIYAAQL